MLETNATQASKLTLVKESSPAKKPISLKDIVKNDPEVLEFFKIAYEHDMREKALELLERRMAKKD